MIPKNRNINIDTEKNGDTLIHSKRTEVLVMGEDISEGLRELVRG